MKKITVISFLLLFFCTSLINAGEVDKNLHTQCLYPTIYVGRADKSGFGSGVIVRSEERNDDEGYENVFLSCAHLVDDNIQDYEVKQYIYEDWSTLKETKTYPAHFYAHNHDMDISIGVFYSKEKMPIAKLNFDPKLFIGNEVFRIGCGLGDDPRLDYGKMSWYKKTGSTPRIRTSVMTVPGDSGSPLFHENEVIGIMVAIRTYRNLPVFNISYAVPLDQFRQWSKSKNNALDFAWVSDKEMPRLPFYFLQFKEYEVK